jgi:hypothetical protein
VTRKNLVDLRKVVGALIDCLEVLSKNLILMDDFGLPLSPALQRSQLRLQDLDLLLIRVLSNFKSDLTSIRQSHILRLSSGKLALIFSLLQGTAAARIVFLQEAIKLQ